jgi:hypothetical protein
MRKNRHIPEINAGSMADIAFLLLIFFLVTASIQHDVGFNRILPPEKEREIVDIKERNLFEISINADNELLVEGEIIELKYLRKMATSFLDNGGIQKGEVGFCGYCLGEHSAALSDNPEKAIISLKTSRNSDYSFYITVQNEIIGAYNFLRNREGRKLYGRSYVSLISEYNKSETEPSKNIDLKEKIEVLRGKFPQKFIEPENINSYR